jgi:hypothetical protein
MEAKPAGRLERTAVAVAGLTTRAFGAVITGLTLPTAGLMSLCRTRLGDVWPLDWRLSRAFSASRCFSAT